MHRACGSTCPRSMPSPTKHEGGAASNVQSADQVAPNKRTIAKLVEKQTGSVDCQLIESSRSNTRLRLRARLVVSGIKEPVIVN